MNENTEHETQYSDEELMEAAQRCANTYAKIANKELGTHIPIPVRVEFDLCDHDPKTAGRAYPNMKIGINLVLYRDNVKEFLNNVIPHEMGHLVQFDKFELKGHTIQGHGVEWQEIMRRYGKDPQKYHHMDYYKAVEHFKAAKKEKVAEEKRAAKEAAIAEAKKLISKEA